MTDKDYTGIVVTFDTKMFHACCCVVMLFFVEYTFACPKPCYCDRSYKVICNSVTLTEETLKRMKLPPRTISVRFSNNGLTRISSDILRNFENVSSLEISKNNIHSIPENLFVRFTSLRKLKLKRNRIRILHHASFNGLEELDYLSLEGNLISTLPAGVFQKLQSLRTLLLSANIIPEISNGVFTQLSNLKNLYLSNNNISRIRGKAFQNLRLKKLGLSFNKLVTLPTDAFEGFDVVFKIFLLYNPLSCGCKELMTYMHHYAHLKNKMLGHCSTPVKLRNINILTAYKYTKCSMCDLSLCQNDGGCVGNYSSMQCKCNDRFTGRLCEVDVCRQVIDDMRKEEILRRLQYDEEETVLSQNIEWEKETKFIDVVEIEKQRQNVEMEKQQQDVEIKKQRQDVEMEKEQQNVEMKTQRQDVELEKERQNVGMKKGRQMVKEEVIEDVGKGKEPTIIYINKTKEGAVMYTRDEEARNTIVILYLTCSIEFLIIFCLVVILVWRKCDDWKIERRYNTNTFTHAHYKTYFSESSTTGIYTGNTGTTATTGNLYGTSTKF